jgi:RNase P/RNase MRP subunit p30
MPKKRINKKPGEMTKSLMRLARENYLDLQREYQRALEEDSTDRATLFALHFDLVQLERGTPWIMKEIV